jgi:hypothetical protein
MKWGKRRAIDVLDVQMNPPRKAGNRKRVIIMASSIGFAIGTILLGMATIWLLSMQAFLQNMVP